ncbi:hypothetical protein ACL03H_11615 [Saccharopolyspora sp. MS10]|uniref:hypothetical protein n=1 Tax=Saccharopolyspora sp. MS10 TaxID=3385973 RepID=UPI0039A172C9
MLSDGKYLTATGHRVLESWRSDLVRTQQYGIMPALKNAGNNLRRPDCSYPSTAVGDARIAVIEDCPGDPTDRLTVIKTKPEDDEEPEEVGTTVLNASDATAVAVTPDLAAVYLRDRGALVVYTNATGGVRADYPVPADGGAVPPGGVESLSPDRTWSVRLGPVAGPERPRAARAISGALSRFDASITEQRVFAELSGPASGRPLAVLDDEQYRQVENELDDAPGVLSEGLLYWHTGTRTVALDATTFAPRWTVPDALGAGAEFGGQLLVPVPGGIAVLDRVTGARQRVIPVDRGRWRGPVAIDTAGSTLLEQRGPDLVGLG